MPATFLSRASAHHLASTLSDFGEATLRDGGRYVWFSETTGGNTYTMPVPCSISAPKRRAGLIAGLLEMQEGEVAIHLDLTALPFTPLIADETHFLIAPAVIGATGLLAPHETDQKKYIVKTLTEPLAGSNSLRFTAALVS